jgi:hypothetical protein
MDDQAGEERGWKIRIKAKRWRQKYEESEGVCVEAEKWRQKDECESQRDSGAKPRVARKEQPWVCTWRSHQPGKGCG